MIPNVSDGGGGKEPIKMMMMVQGDDGEKMLNEGRWAQEIA